MSAEPQADPVARMLYAERNGDAPDAFGRTHWMLSWVEGIETLAQGWYGTLDELSKMAARRGFGGVEVKP